MNEEQLDLSYQRLKKMPKIPYGTKFLVCTGNFLEEVGRNLPDTIENILLTENLFNEVPEVPDSVRCLSLSNNFIKRVEYIPDFLEMIFLGENQISYIEYFPDGLKVLYLQSNTLRDIPELPLALEELYIHDNRLNSLPELPKSLKKLDCADNDIESLPELPEGLIILNCSDNLIKKLPELPSTLETLDCRVNALTDIPSSILNCRRMRTALYFSNPYTVMNPIIERFLERINPRNIGNIYDDHQSVHNSSIQKSIKNSIINLLKDPYKGSYNFLEDQDIPCKDILLEYCEDTSVHSILGVTFSEVLSLILHRISDSPNRKEILKILEHEMNDSMCKCFTGRISRLVNVLNGFYDDIVINISDTEQISSIVTQIMKTYPQHQWKSIVIERLNAMNLSEETIKVWTEDL